MYEPLHLWAVFAMWDENVLKWDGMGWNFLKWDGMGWDEKIFEMGWDGMG